MPEPLRQRGQRGQHDLVLYQAFGRDECIERYVRIQAP
jgi:hypothetical protein